MIIECEKCGSLYNNQTVKKCPACNEYKPDWKEIKKDRGIKNYRKGQIREMRRTQASQRMSDRSIWESQKGK